MSNANERRFGLGQSASFALQIRDVSVGMARVENLPGGVLIEVDTDLLVCCFVSHGLVDGFPVDWFGGCEAKDGCKDDEGEKKASNEGEGGHFGVVKARLVKEAIRKDGRGWRMEEGVLIHLATEQRRPGLDLNCSTVAV